MIKTKQNVPEADVLMTSMRAMGYTFESAIADVIDNSICANARNIKVFMPISSKEKSVCIFDDGRGMNEDELQEAMKYGSNIGARSENDLGRFGLGLKAASLSQCRVLTVISKKNNLISGMQWDLDYIQKKKDWLVKILSKEEIELFPHIKLFDTIEHGTFVFWEKFDSIDTTKISAYTSLSRKMLTLEKHLSWIFHRYMDESSSNRINFSINFKQLTPLDPFLEKHKKTTKNEIINIPICDRSGVERIVSAQAFILPHFCDLTPEDQERLGGFESMKTQQGFYVYRNKRLIIWGSWFGMPKEELNKYARIKVDIPNTLDDIWHIDIKKQHATIPASVQDRLKKAIEKARGQSERKTSYRGTKKQNEVRLWYPSNNRGTLAFRINRDASIFNLLKNLDEKNQRIIELILDEIEKTIPYNDIYLGMAHGTIVLGHNQQLSEDRLRELEGEASMIWDVLFHSGVTDEDVICQKIFATEPFCDHKEQLLQRLKNNMGDKIHA